MAIDDPLNAFEWAARSNPFRKWLETETAKHTAALIVSTELARIHQLQGRLQLLNEMSKLIEAAAQRK
jgi:hypothetical protein